MTGKSPFAKKNQTVFDTPTLVRPSDVVVQPMMSPNPIVPVFKSSAFSNQTSPTFAISASIGDKDVESLGADVGKSVSNTTEKIVSKMTLSNFDELGKTLAVMQIEAGNLDSKKINDELNPKGMFGWLKKKIKNVRAELVTRLNTASEAFDKLETELVKHIGVQDEWVKDLELLYNENYNNYKMITELIVKAEEWDKNLEATIKALPAIDPADPEAIMKSQLRRDLESRLNRLRIKIDNFRRHKVVTENNGPKIRSQQDSSRTVIQTIRDVIDSVPVIKMEFTLFIQSLDVRKSTNLVNASRSLIRDSLTKSADSAKDAAVGAANNLNSAIIDNDTLNHIRNRLIETVVEVKQIEANAQQQRIADAKMIQDSQTEYLTKLTQNNAV